MPPSWGRLGKKWDDRGGAVEIIPRWKPFKKEFEKRKVGGKGSGREKGFNYGRGTEGFGKELKTKGIMDQ